MWLVEIIPPGLIALGSEVWKQLVKYFGNRQIAIKNQGVKIFP